MVLIEALSRQIPGVVGQPDSVERDSFRTGCWTIRTTPGHGRSRGVGCRTCCSPVIMPRSSVGAGGRALRATLEKRPDLLADRPLDLEEEQLLDELRSTSPSIGDVTESEDNRTWHGNMRRSAPTKARGE